MLALDLQQRYSIYVNGRSLALKPTVMLNGAPFGGDTKQNNLGYDSYSSDKFFIGSLDELLVYDTALSASDAGDLYGGRRRTYDDPSRYPHGRNLVAGYHLDEGRGTTVRDFTGHGNDGAFSGGATWVRGADAAAEESSEGKSRGSVPGKEGKG
jgi:hypothetical protein